MPRLLLSILLVTFMTPFLSGCGEEKPMVEGELKEMEELDPVDEAAAVKEALKSQ